MAFKRWNKSPSKSPPEKTWTFEEMKIIGWCLNNNIKIGVVPDWKNDIRDHYMPDVSFHNRS